MDKNNNYAIIMAGGIGSRLWPVSTKERPKQFIDILKTGETLLQSTYNKYLNLCSKNNIYIITNEKYQYLIKQQLPNIQSENILYEPIGRSTSVCIAYASYKIALKNSEANIIVTPSDHLLGDDKHFIDTLTTAITFSNNNNYIVSVGIKPYTPYTQYGYIQYEHETSISKDIYKIKAFTEKPSEKIAKQFLLSGDFLWNTGIFTCKATNLINAFGKHLNIISHLFWEATPALNTPKEKEIIKEVYSQCPSISIDYGIMEKADNICTVIAKFDWLDLGSWPAVYNSIHTKDANQNVIINVNKIKLINVNKCLIYNTQPDKQLSLRDLSNCIIINTDEGLLIIDKFKHY